MKLHKRKFYIILLVFVILIAISFLYMNRIEETMKSKLIGKIVYYIDHDTLYEIIPAVYNSFTQSGSKDLSNLAKYFEIYGSFESISKDGKKILYYYDAQKKTPRTHEIHIIDIHKNSANTIISLKAGLENREAIPINYASWSPSYEYIAFIGGGDTSGDEGSYLYVIPATENSTITSIPKKLIEEPVISSRPSWSPDGRYIYCTLKDGFIIKVNITNSTYVQLFKGLQPSISHSGNELAFRDTDNIYSYNFKSEQKKLIVKRYNVYKTSEMGERWTELVWSPDDKYLLYTRDTQALWLQLIGWLALSNFYDMMIVPVEHPNKKICLLHNGEFVGISWIP